MIVCLDFWYQLLYNYHGVEMNIFNAIFALFDMLTVLHNLYTFGHICSMWLLGLLNVPMQLSRIWIFSKYAM